MMCAVCNQKQCKCSGDERASAVIKRYQNCVMRLLNMFEGDPLPEDHPAHFFVDRLEALIDLDLIGPTWEALIPHTIDMGRKLSSGDFDKVKVIGAPGTEEFKCPRRAESGDRFKLMVPGPDFWRMVGTDRVCSYCGGMHPEDFLALVPKAIAGEDGIEFDLADRKYKIYVRQPDIRNASEGAIKFYLCHLSPQQFADNQRSINEALFNSMQRLFARSKIRIGDEKEKEDEETT